MQYGIVWQSGQSCCFSGEGLITRTRLKAPRLVHSAVWNSKCMIWSRKPTLRIYRSGYCGLLFFTTFPASKDFAGLGDGGPSVWFPDPGVPAKILPQSLARLLAARKQTMSGLVANRGFIMNVGAPSHRLTTRWGNPMNPRWPPICSSEESRGNICFRVLLFKCFTLGVLGNLRDADNPRG